MRLFYWGIILIIIGLSLFALSAYQGEGGFVLFLIFPVFYSTGVWGLVAILLMFVGFFLIFISPFYGSSHISMHQPHFEERKGENIVEKRTEKHYGGVVLIGPIPIIFGSDRNMVILSILAVILILVAIGILFILLS